MDTTLHSNPNNHRASFDTPQNYMALRSIGAVVRLESNLLCSCRGSPDPFRDTAKISGVERPAVIAIRYVIEMPRQKQALKKMARDSDSQKEMYQ
jgi:hypothetical protein